MKYTLPIIAVLGIIFASESQAVVLAGWDFTGVSGFSSDPVSPTAIAPGLTATLTRGTGLTTTGTSSSDSWGASGINQTSAATAISNGDYFLFTITASAGVTFSIDSIDAYRLVRSNSTYPSVGIDWWSSRNGGSLTDLGVTTTAMGSGTLSGSKSPISTPFTSVNFDNLTSVTFAMAMYATSTLPGANDALFFQNNSGSPFTISGTVNGVPEPGAGALLGLIGAGLLLRRRRRS